MIRKVTIRNFKSIRCLDFECTRVNVFIGAPNTGKSNIIEALGLFSVVYVSDLRDLVRVERTSNLFYDENIDEPIIVRCDDLELTLRFNGRDFTLSVTRGSNLLAEYTIDFNARITGRKPITRVELPIKLYRYRPLTAFWKSDLGYLYPPHGPNLMAILLTRKDLRSLVSNMVRPYGLRLVFKPQEGKIELLKYYEEDEILVSIPYSLLSDTLRRAIFYLVAIKSNRRATLLLEEPEVHSFPEYVKTLAEVIGHDKHNQYFITTHNPYLLLSLLEKTPANEISVFITYMRNYETKLRRLSHDEISELMSEGIDIFFNLEYYLEEER